MKPLFLKFLLTAAFGFFAWSASAQFQTVYLGINGLTCSQCSRSVEMQLRKLPFVANVDMNLAHTEGKITLNKGMKADMDKIAQAVFDAGFSVRYLKADLVVDKTVTQSGSCLNYKGDGYVLSSPPAVPLTGTVKLTFIGKKFQSRNEYKKADLTANGCGAENGKVYHVAM